jgi:hypothetical protein
MKNSFLKNISLAGFLLLVFSACGPDNLDMTDLDKDENEVEVVLCNMSVELVESIQTMGLLGSWVTDGTQPYSYLWSTGQTTQEITVNSNGWYSIEVTDAEGCVANDSLEVAAVDPCWGFSVMLAEQPPGSGMLYSAVTGGSGNYTYEWSTGETTANINVSVNGNYTLIVTDSDGCVVVGFIEIGNNNDPCLGLSMALAEQPPGSGNLYSSVIGGTAPYSYSWSSGETTQDIVVTNSGSYFCVVTDDLGCMFTETIDVVLNDPCAQFDVEIVEAPVGSGILDGVAIGGTAPYSYSWSTGEISLGIEASMDGIYGLTITDAEGCVETDSYEVMLGVNPCQNFSVVIAEQPPGSGAIYSAVSGGAAPYSYLWSTGETTADIQVNTFGTYTLAVTDSEGCVFAVFIEI